MSDSSSSDAEILNSGCYPTRHPTGPGGDAPPELAKPKVDDEHKCQVVMVKREYENLMDQLKVEHDIELNKLREAYQAQIDELKLELERLLKNTQLSVTTAVQEVVSQNCKQVAPTVLEFCATFIKKKIYNQKFLRASF